MVPIIPLDNIKVVVKLVKVLYKSALNIFDKYFCIYKESLMLNQMDLVEILIIYQYKLGKLFVGSNLHNVRIKKK